MSTWGMEHAIVTMAVIMIMIAVLMLCSLLDKVTTRTIAYRGVGHTNASLLAYRGVVIGYYTSVYHRLFPMPPALYYQGRPGNGATTSTHHDDTQNDNTLLCGVANTLLCAWHSTILQCALLLVSTVIDITVLRGYETAANTDSIRRFLKTVIASIASIATHSNP